MPPPRHVALTAGRPCLTTALIAAGAALAAYLPTLAPGLAGGDAGELTVAAASFSVAHPPGYPLYIALGKGASLFPFGSLSWRLNLFSALAGAGAAAFLAAALLRLTQSAPAALAGALLYALSPLAWTWATRADVFALNALCASALLWLATRFDARPSPRLLMAGAVVTGLGMGNHHTLLWLALPLSAWSVTVAVGRGEGHAVAKALALGAAAFVLVHLQLLAGARFAPEHAWGQTATPSGLVHHLLRRDYGTFQLAASTGGHALSKTFGSLGERLWVESLGVGALLALVGAVVLLSDERRRGLGLAVTAALLLYATSFPALARFPLSSPLLSATLDRFWLLPLLLVCTLAGVGFARALRDIPERAAWGVLAMVLAVACGHGLARRARVSKESLSETYARTLLADLSADALVLARGDLLSNALRYVQFAEHVRPDVAVLDQELLSYPWYVEQVRKRHPSLTIPPGERGAGWALGDLLRANPSRPTFVVGGTGPGSALGDELALWPYGLTEQVGPARRALEEALEAAAPAQRALEVSVLAEAARRPLADAWEEALAEEVWEAQHRPTLARLRWAMAQGAPPKRLESVAAEYRALIEAHPDAPAAYYKNLGLACGHAGNERCMREALRAYLERVPEDAPDRAAVEQHLRRD